MHTNSHFFYFEISTHRFRSTTFVDWMQKLYFMIGSVVCTRSLAVASTEIEKSQNLCTKHFPLEWANMIFRDCIYMSLRSIKTINQTAVKISCKFVMHESQLVEISVCWSIKPTIEMQSSSIQFSDFLSLHLFWTSMYCSKDHLNTKSWLVKIGGCGSIKPKIEMQPPTVQFFDFLKFHLCWASFVLFQRLFQY